MVSHGRRAWIIRWQLAHTRCQTRHPLARVDLMNWRVWCASGGHEAPHSSDEGPRAEGIYAGQFSGIDVGDVKPARRSAVSATLAEIGRLAPADARSLVAQKHETRQ